MDRYHGLTYEEAERRAYADGDRPPPAAPVTTRADPTAWVRPRLVGASQVAPQPLSEDDSHE